MRQTLSRSRVSAYAPRPCIKAPDPSFAKYRGLDASTSLYSLYVNTQGVAGG